jgi:two-component system response regulator QseB
VDELLARVRALQRRLRGAAVNVLEHGSLQLDPISCSVMYAGRPVPLQRREFMLLQKLLAAAGQVHTRAQLEESIYGWEGNVESNALDVHVHNLRKKLYPEVIRTVRGIGYVADPPA